MLHMNTQVHKSLHKAGIDQQGHLLYAFSLMKENLHVNVATVISKCALMIPIK